MSRIATAWAWSLNIKPASHKLVLLSMADRADEFNKCYPSIMRLCDDTGLDRKTVISAMLKLSSNGVIFDTGERKGATKQVKVFGLSLVEKTELKGTDNGTDKEKKPTKNKPSQKRNSTENGTVPEFPSKGTENGTLNSTENGTRNQSLEPFIETETPSKLGPCRLAEYLEYRKLNKLPTFPKNAEGENRPDKYAKSVSMPEEFLYLAWRRFKLEHIDGSRAKKKQAAWDQTFENCLRGNWYKFWWLNSDDQWELTTTGKQAQMEFATERAA